jgi:hypothetical protein
MKHTLIVMVYACLAVNAYSQNTPMEFLNAVPQPPSKLCELGIEGKMNYLDKLASFDSVFRLKMEELQQGNEQFQEEHQEEETVNALIKAGYSREDAEKMKNLDKMSEEEQAALANQVMMNQYNMTLGEANKIAEYDTAAQRRWAKAQSTITMVEYQADPEKNTKKQLEIKSDLELQQEIKWLNDKLRAAENKWLDKFLQIDMEADSARSVIDPKIDKLYKDLNEGNGNSEMIIKKIVSLRQQYCEKFTPLYLKTVEGFKGYVAEHMQEYIELEEMQVKLTERQVGIKNPDYKPGMAAMGIVGSYRNVVGEAFKYNLNSDIGAQFIGY